VIAPYYKYISYLKLFLFGATGQATQLTFPLENPMHRRSRHSANAIQVTLEVFFSISPDNEGIDKRFSS
jgi:hypothetical protein